MTPFIAAFTVATAFSLGATVILICFSHFRVTESDSGFGLHHPKHLAERD